MGPSGRGTSTGLAPQTLVCVLSSVRPSLGVAWQIRDHFTLVRGRPRSHPFNYAH